MARGLKFWIKEEEGLYFLCSENKGADQLRLCFRLCKKPVFSQQGSYYLKKKQHHELAPCAISLKGTLMQKAGFLTTRLILFFYKTHHELASCSHVHSKDAYNYMIYNHYTNSFTVATIKIINFQGFLTW